MKVLIVAMFCMAAALAAPTSFKQFGMGGSSAPVRIAAPKMAEHFSTVASLSVPHDRDLEIRFILKNTNMDILKKEALAVSDPKSPRYGKYLSVDDIDRLTAPDAKDVAIVTSWLEHNGVSFERRNEVITAKMTVAKAQSFFGTEFTSVYDSLSDRTLLRAGDYYLPMNVASRVQSVFGLHGLPLPPKAQKDLKSFGPPSVTPSVLYSTYSVSGVDVNRNGNNSLAVGEYQHQTMNKADLSAFFKNEVPNAQPGDDQVSKFVGAPYSPGSGVEALLDIEYIMGVAPGVKAQFWGFLDQDFCGDMQKYTDTLLHYNGAPLVSSISYGWQGDLSQLGCQQPEITTIDNTFAKLAARGLTICISSGDSGSGYSPFEDGSSVQLYPSWPASSPWVTAVGATAFTGDVGSEEMASSQFGSGGGFSTMFNQTHAQWQAEAVAAYVKQGANLPKFPPSGSFPANGRATPDVSGLGEGYQVYVNGNVESVGGTSASSPMFAGLVALINEERLSKGQSPMGFLNPFLYQNPDAFFDVTKGTNAISRGGMPVNYGYAAATGWDAATGLGTPHFDKLLAAALQAGETTKHN